MANGRHGNGIPPNKSRRRTGRQPERIDSILERTTWRMGLPNMVEGSTRWKPPTSSEEQRNKAILRKRLKWRLPQRQIDAIIAQQKTVPKWMEHALTEFNEVDRMPPKGLRRDISQHYNKLQQGQSISSGLRNKMLTLAISNARPNEAFYSSAERFLQEQLLIFENERALAIREFVLKARNKKASREEYTKVMRYIQGCGISVSITREILQNPRYMKTWAIEEFAELKQLASK